MSIVMGCGALNRACRWKLSVVENNSCKHVTVDERTSVHTFFKKKKNAWAWGYSSTSDSNQALVCMRAGVSLQHWRYVSKRLQCCRSLWTLTAGLGNPIVSSCGIHMWSWETLLHKKQRRELQCTTGFRFCLLPPLALPATACPCLPLSVTARYHPLITL